jgi:hypothetical protein
MQSLAGAQAGWLDAAGVAASFVDRLHRPSAGPSGRVCERRQSRSPPVLAAGSQRAGFAGARSGGSTRVLAPVRASRTRAVAAQAKKVDKVVLAYSGGLDTSVILKWLQETYGCEVITFTADLGQVRARTLLQGRREGWLEVGLRAGLQQRRSTCTAILRGSRSPAGHSHTKAAVLWQGSPSHRHQAPPLAPLCALQGEELEPARQKAEAAGVKQIFIEDLREEFVRDYVFPMFRWGAGGSQLHVAQGHWSDWSLIIVRACLVKICVAPMCPPAATTTTTTATLHLHPHQPHPHPLNPPQPTTRHTSHTQGQLAVRGRLPAGHLYRPAPHRQAPDRDRARGERLGPGPWSLVSGTAC